MVIYLMIFAALLQQDVKGEKSKNCGAYVKS